MDTSVLIAANKPRDPDYESAKKILDSKMHKLTSYIALAELVSVISRLLVAKQIEIDPQAQKILEKLDDKEKAKAIALYILRKGSVEILECLGLVPSGIFGVDVPIEFQIGIKIAPITRLKTLDNLHIATAMLNKKSNKIEFFITGDKEILKKSRTINEISGLVVLSPKEATEKLYDIEINPFTNSL